jgi:lysozyme
MMQSGYRNWRQALTHARDVIRDAEGYSDTVYYIDGKPHIGWGHLIADSVEFSFYDGRTICNAEGEDLWRRDLDSAISAVARQYPEHGAGKGMEPARLSALVEMAYCLGNAGLAGFTDMRAAIERGNWDAAEQELKDSQWWRKQGKRLPGVRKRLKRLRLQLKTGEF